MGRSVLYAYFRCSTGMTKATEGANSCLDNTVLYTNHAESISLLMYHVHENISFLVAQTHTTLQMGKFKCDYAPMTNENRNVEFEIPTEVAMANIKQNKQANSVA
jgi:hypothetical protein